MNKGTLKTIATKIVSCEICGSKIKREKTFKMTVSENEVEQAKIEIKKQVNDWTLTDKQKHCHICWSIVKDQ